MSIIVTADLHWSDNPRDAYRHKFVEWLVGCIDKHKVEALFVLGDLTDAKDEHRAWLVNQVVGHIFELSCHCPVVILRGNHDCNTDDTEVLTRRGWLHNSQILLDDVVLGLDQTTGKGSWQPINSVVRKFADELWYCSGRGYDIGCTNTHRVFVQDKKGGFDYVQPAQVTNNHLIVSSVCVDNCDVELSDDEIRLAAWILTDGHVDCHGYISIYQSKHVDLIDSLLARMCLNARRTERDRVIHEIVGRSVKSTKTHVEWHLRAEQSHALTSRLGLARQSKSMPMWVWELSSRQFEVFLDTVILADGTVYKHKQWQATLYKDESFLSAVQALLHMHGYRGVLSTNTRGHSVLNICKRVASGENSLRFVSKRLAEPAFVWCLTVPLGNFMVRRNGKAYLSGNCLSPDCPFFGFVDKFDDVYWINRPQDFSEGLLSRLELERRIGRFVLLPHTSDYKAEWAELNFSSYVWAFTHNTFDGSNYGQGPLAKGIPPDVFPVTCTVLSGDVHIPQRVPPVIYVGAPYLIDFGDDFVPRVALIKGQKLSFIPVAGVQKRLVEIKSLADLKKVKLDDGDIVKVRIDMLPSERSKWPEMQAAIKQWADEQGLVLSSSQPMVGREPGKQRQVRTIDDKQLVREYVKQRGADQATERAGIRLVDKA